MLERVAPGSNYDTREFYDRLREIKATISPSLGRKMVDKASDRKRSTAETYAGLLAETAIWTRGNLRKSNGELSEEEI